MMSPGRASCGFSVRARERERLTSLIEETEKRAAKAELCGRARLQDLRHLSLFLSRARCLLALSRSLSLSLSRLHTTSAPLAAR